MKRAPSRAGFTLVELLVAVTITLALAGVMLMVTIGTLNLWRRAQNSFSTDTQAKLVLDYLERDLQTALFRQDGKMWMKAEIFDSALTAHGWLSANPMKPITTKYVPDGTTPLIADARFGQSGQWFRFITTNGGLPAAVGYQMVRRSLTAASAPDPDSIRYSLYRVAVSSDSTFTTGYNITDHDGVLIKPSTSDAIATNVVDFGVWLYARDSFGALNRIFPADASDGTHTVATLADFPAVADVMIRVLTDEGAAMIAAMEQGLVPVPASYAGNVAGWWWSVVEAHSHVYTRRVEVSGTAI